jgi:hypothetical protein
MKGNRIAIVAAVVVVAIGLAFLALRGFWPPKSGTEGTIGAAHRYTAQQIADQDVVLKDPKVQAFLQSDTFHKLATDPQFRALVQNALWTEACKANQSDIAAFTGGLAAVEKLNLSDAARLSVGDDALRKMRVKALEVGFGNAAVCEFLSDPAVVEFLNSPEAENAIDNGGVAVEGKRLVIKERNGHEIFDLDKGGCVVDGKHLEIVGRPGPRELWDLLTSSTENLNALEASISNADFRRWIKMPGTREVLDALARSTDGNTGLALANENVRELTANKDFGLLIENNTAFAEALKTEEFQELAAATSDWAKVLKLSKWEVSN